MIEFLAGLALGTAFAPFWMMVWNTVKPVISGFFAKKP